MGFLSNILGQGGAFLGQKAGEALGSLLPFRRGGRVKPQMMDGVIMPIKKRKRAGRRKAVRKMKK